MKSAAVILSTRIDARWIESHNFSAPTPGRTTKRRSKMNVSRLAGRAAGALCAAAAGVAFSTAHAQDIRMYAFSSGALTLGKGILQNLAPLEPPLQLPVGFYLIRHPKGNVLFDTATTTSSSPTRATGPPRTWR
jgi:hypothetical protein